MTGEAHPKPHAGDFPPREKGAPDVPNFDLPVARARWDWFDLVSDIYAEVWVNGTSCGSRLWGPHVFDIGKVLRPGRNEIHVRVANLINNSYGEFAESGLFGPVRIVRLR